MVACTYNSYVIPAIMGKFSYSEDEKEIKVGLDFLVTADTSALLITACQAAESALTEVNKNLTLSLGGTNDLVFNHSSNTGFLSKPNLSKLVDAYNTGTSRHYHWSCSFGLPFSQSGYNFQREASWSISYGANRQRTVNFKVLY